MKKILFILALILLLGAFFRFKGLDWDEGHHLHPDERFLTMVVHDLKWPADVGEYFDETRSGLNPRNVGHSFFGYGTLPTTLIKAITLLINKSDYDNISIIGRFICGLLDLLVIIFIFLIGRILYDDDRIALLASFFYSVTVLPIQISHFYSVDSFANFFIIVSIYFLVRIQKYNKIKDYFFCGIFFGLAISSKISILTFVIIFPLVTIYHLCKSKTDDASTEIIKSILKFSLTLVIAFLTFRICQPDAFQTSCLFSFNNRWLKTMSDMSSLMKGTVDYPPSHQWANRIPIWHPWKNMVIWGMGIPLGITAWTGLIFSFILLIKKQSWKHLIPVSWIVFIFLYHGTQFIMPMRYFLPIYPMMVIIAAWFLINIYILIYTKLIPKILIGIIALGTLLWAFSFLSIYTHPHTRIEASRWIYENIPSSSTIATEHWDDILPLSIKNKPPLIHYKNILLELYNDDTPEKLDKLVNQLDSADYIIISSNRLYDSITRLPMRYPMTIKYYDALFNGTLGFEKVAEFTSYPNLFGLKFPDQCAEEPFTVYDHPKVQIFKKNSSYNSENAKDILGNIDWNSIIRMLPKDVSKAPSALMFTDNQQREYTDSGTWIEIFNRRSISNYAPILSWFVIIQILGLLGASFLFKICHGLPDRGYSFSKIVGILLFGWLVWILVSLHLFPYTKIFILLTLFVLGLAAFIIARHNATEIQIFWKNNKRIIIIEEVIFCLLFLLFTLIRYFNPDLWHPFLGGEKPMDFAYLNAVIKSKYFPPYDPWFAGGFVNYYYFGFILWGTLVKISGIIPSVVYNLIIPTIFAITAIGAFGITLALVHNKNKVINKIDYLYSILGMFFVSIIGNLGTFELIIDGLKILCTTSKNTLSEIVIYLHAFPISIESWYWHPTRLISHPASEAGPINEFPFFTYLFADLHAHAMALPLTLLIIGLGLAYLKSTKNRLGFYFLFPLTLGGLWITNTWDLPTYGILTFIILLLYEWRNTEETYLSKIFKAFKSWLIIIILSYVFYYPFHRYFANPYTGITLWKGSKTPLADYLMIHGFFLYIITAYLATQLFYKRLSLNFKYSFLPIILLLLSFVLFTYGFILHGLLVILLSLTVYLFLRSIDDTINQLTLVMIGLGLILSLAVEFITISGDIGRMNTVFKFYLQIWILFSIASISGFSFIRKHFHMLPVIIRRLWLLGFIILFICVSLYPVTATVTKTKDRFFNSKHHTLDGMAFLRGTAIYDKERIIKLNDDFLAIRWIQDNLKGSPVIVEANTTPNLYSWGNRISVYTGLPSIIGWDWHQKQQKAILQHDVVLKRIKDVETIYNSTDQVEAYKLLKKYHAKYLILGELERAYYKEEGLSKFSSKESTLWKLVFDIGKTKIYKIN